MIRGLVVALVLAGCIDNIDPAWQLDHDRIVAVRATPPRVRPGEHALLDALVAHKGGPTDVERPIGATAAKPTSLFASVLDDQGTWQVVAPPDSELASARGELGLAADAPVPLSVVMELPDSNGHSLFATKVVWLGDTGANPPEPAITVDGEPPGDSILVPPDKDVPLAIDVDPAWHVSWLTSCGTMHDDDEPAAFLHVLPADRQTGELATIVRDDLGGVSWLVRPIAAQ